MTQKAKPSMVGGPPENLVTQGYGEQFPKLNTLAAEPLNCRVDVRRITPLMSGVSVMIEKFLAATKFAI